MERAVARALFERGFWLLPTLTMALAVVLGVLLPELDQALAVDFGLFGFRDAQSARSLLSTIATVTVSVIGISFSVVVVAFQLAAQQLGPRVLRTFQRDRLTQAVLAVFIAAAVYALVLLTQLANTAGQLPQVALAVAIVWALAAFALFIAFMQRTVEALQASTVIARIASEGRLAIEQRYPSRIGRPARHEDGSDERARQRMAEREPALVRATEAGFLTRVEGEAVLRAAEAADGFVQQRVAIGDWVLSGDVVAEVWPSGDQAGRLIEAVRTAHVLARDRAFPHDVAFPLRQLADIALRALSPALNDPTTAENALSAATDLLVRFARSSPVTPLRADEHGEPRLLARAPSLDELAMLAFAQVCDSAGENPLVVARLRDLLGRVTQAALGAGLLVAATEERARALAGGSGERLRPAS